MKNTIRKTMMSALMVSLAFIAFSVNANAATFVVNTTADTQDANAGNGICADSGGACSLRAAITEANALAGADIITLPAGTYTQSLVADNENLNAGGDFDITSAVTINGAGSGATIIQANALPDTATERVIHCLTAATAVVINDVTIRHGNTTMATFSTGSGIRLETATTNLTLNRVIVTNNRSASGGGGISLLASGIVLNINDSTISNNNAGSSLINSNGVGAGISVFGTATVNITNTMVTGNMSNTSAVGGNFGAGIYIAGGSSNVTITGSTISGNTLNSSVANTFGAGISVLGSAGSNVTITGSTISNNSATSTAANGFSVGGGVYNREATVNINNSIIEGNTSDDSGGIRIEAQTRAAAANITNSTIRNNSAQFNDGGGVLNATFGTGNSITTITNSTISDNSATNSNGFGGGILNFSFSTGVATVNLINSTVSRNSSAVGSGIYNEGSVATVNLNYSTIVSNTAFREGGGLYQDNTVVGGIINLKNSIVADNAAPTGPDIFGTITSQNYNHVENTTGGIFTPMANDVIGSDPQLGALANNGGTTQTHLPAATSPVVNTIPPGTSDCGTTITTDQRGFPRPSGAGCDKGSVEVQGVATPTPTPTPTQTPTPSPTPTPTPTPGGGGTCTPTTTVSEGDLAPGGIVSFGVTSGPGSVTVDHVNAGTGLQSLTVVGMPTNATVNIPTFTPGTINPVTVTFTVNNTNNPVDFTLRAASHFHAAFIRVRCVATTCIPTSTVTEGDLAPGGIVSFGVTTGTNSVTIDHVNAGTGLRTLTIVGTPTNAVVNIPSFTPGTIAPVTVTFTIIDPNQPVDFTLRAASSFHAVFIRVRCETLPRKPELSGIVMENPVELNNPTGEANWLPNVALNRKAAAIR